MIRLFRLSILCMMLTAVGCNNNQKEVDSNGVYVDKDFTRMYMPDKGGVTSADGTISFTLNDGSSIFMTGDCFTGDVRDGKRERTDPMLNNAFIHISAKGKYLRSIYGADGSSLYVPAEADTSRVHFWYWPAHAFHAPDGTLYVAMAKLYQETPGQWGFKGAGLDLLKADPKTFEMTDRIEMFHRSCPLDWAQCILNEGEDVYLYATDTFGGVYAWETSLTAIENLFSPEQGPVDTDEAGLPEGAFRCEGVDVPVSAQFSVFRLKDKYVLLTKDRFSPEGEIYSFISDSPCGPWKGKKLIWRTTEQNDKELFTYNAMAHPQYINKRGEILICYNINSSNLTRIMDEVDTYRPVFLRVPADYILP